MRKFFILAMMMLPCIVFGQSNDSTEINELKGKVTDAYRRLPAAYQHMALILMEEAVYDKSGTYWVYSGDTIRNMEDMAVRFMNDNIVTGICNIPFGSSYEQSRKILAEKYGDYDSLASSKDCLTYRDKFYAGIHFTDLHFMFQSDGESSYFYKAVLGKDAKTREEAIDIKKSIDEKLGRQYQIYKVLDEGNTCFSIGGMCPVKGEGVLGGYAIGVDILELGQPTRNGCMYNVRISYGPFEYVDETF